MDNSVMQIKKAERKKVKLKIALTGPTGSGKTMSSILLADGLVPGGNILLIDTEDGSSNLYADHPELKGIQFSVLEIDAPYTIQKYLQALEKGQAAGFDVIIIDSISHAWAGEGGLLDKKSGLDSRGGNSYTNWALISKEQELFKSRLVHGPTHVIVTMRSKMEYVIESNEKGKQVPKRVGLAPIQRDGMEYEFTTVFDIGPDHQFQVSKDRTGIFDGQIAKITQKTGEEIRKWMAQGEWVGPKVTEPEIKTPPAFITVASTPPGRSVTAQTTGLFAEDSASWVTESAPKAAVPEVDSHVKGFVIPFGDLAGKHLGEVDPFVLNDFALTLNKGINAKLAAKLQPNPLVVNTLNKINTYLEGINAGLNGVTQAAGRTVP